MQKGVGDHITASLRYGKFKKKDGSLVAPNIATLNEWIGEQAKLKRSQNPEKKKQGTDALESFRQWFSPVVETWGYNKKGLATDQTTDRYASGVDMAKRAQKFDQAITTIRKNTTWTQWLNLFLVPNIQKMLKPVKK